MKTVYEMDASQVEDLIDGSISPRLQKALSITVRNGLRDLEEEHKKKWFLRGNAKNPDTHPTKITWRTGTLAKNYMTYWTSGDLHGYYGSELKRSALLEFGGTIKPVTAGALTIPTEINRMGSFSFLAAKDYPDGMLFRPNLPGGGKASVLAMIGPGGVLMPMFILATQATIPARPTVEKSAKAQEIPFAKAVLDTAIRVMETKDGR